MTGEEQPAPAKNDLPGVWGMVMKDMVDRDQLGRQRYGTKLQPHNGRDALRDAYEEALDMVVYLRQAIAERKDEIRICKCAHKTADHYTLKPTDAQVLGWCAPACWCCAGYPDSWTPA